MTPRERILAALAHKEADRVPVDLGATESSCIAAVAYNRLKQRLGITGGRTQVFDMFQMLAKVELPVVERLGVDALPLYIEPRQWKPWLLPDGSPAEIPARLDIRKMDDGSLAMVNSAGVVTARLPAGGFYFDSVSHPLATATTPQEIDAGRALFEAFDWPAFLDENYADLGRRARQLRETPYPVVANLAMHLLAAGQGLRGFEPFMMDLVADKPLAHRLLERQLEVYLERVDRFMAAVGDNIDLVLLCDDLGTQLGPQLSPQLYREMIKPYQARLIARIKSHGTKLLMHSCGSIYRVIPDLIEIGVDAINPVQVSATDMDSRRLKREFGRDLVFWGGGCDTQQVLARGTPAEVRQEVRRRVDDLAPGGGFVFCQVHNIQADVPVENILAMYEELGTLS